MQWEGFWFTVTAAHQFFFCIPFHPVECSLKLVCTFLLLFTGSSSLSWTKVVSLEFKADEVFTVLEEEFERDGWLSTDIK